MKYTLKKLLMMLGTLLVFAAVLMIMNNQNDAISSAIDKYLQKTSVWVDDYNRQFIRINIKYMVIATVVLFTLLGVMFGMALGGIFGFIVFAIFFILSCLVDWSSKFTQYFSCVQTR